MLNPHTSSVAGMRSFVVSVVVLCGAWLEGAALCLMKGEGGGLAMAVGNLSAPYVVVAVFAGLAARRWWLGAVLGIAATEATVGGFYGTWAMYFGHEVSQHAVMLWGGAGVFSGALFGVVGWVARARAGLRYVLPALLIAEPVVTQIGFVFTSRFGIGRPGMDYRNVFAYSLEIVVGAAVFVVVRRHVRTQRRTMGALAAG